MTRLTGLFYRKYDGKLIAPDFTMGRSGYLKHEKKFSRPKIPDCHLSGHQHLDIV